MSKFGRKKQIVIDFSKRVPLTRNSFGEISYKTKKRRWHLYEWVSLNFGIFWGRLMNYAEIKTCDIANGPGVRVSLFVSGCNHRCKNCFNEVAWDFGYGREFTRETMDTLIGELRPYYIKGLTLLGGEPMEYVNQVGLLPFLKRVKKELPEKDIWCFSGYLFDREIVEEMCPKWEVTRELVSCLDVMVDGRYVDELHDITLQFRGSSNQRLIDVPRSLASGEVILWNGK